MPYARQELQVMRKERLVSQFVNSITKEVVSAAHQGKTSVCMSEPHYERVAWNEFLKDILHELHVQFPGCDIVLDDQLGITVKWD